MPITTDQTIDELNKLIETCKDGEYGFKSCAEHVKSADLKTTFMRRAEDCAKGARELQSLVSRLGGSPNRHQRLGTMHAAGSRWSSP